MNNKVIAPKNGYDSPVKQDYREKVWNSFPDYVVRGCQQIEECHVLILPSKEGLEIPLLINMGIPENKIIAIDRNPAIIASSQWRKDYPNVKFYVKSVSEVGEKLTKNKQVLIAANLDLCNNFSHKLIDELNLFFKYTPRYSNFCFSITMAKGRESTEVNTLLDLLNGDNRYSTIKDKRMFTLMNILNKNFSFKTVGTSLLHLENYILSRTPMVFASFRMFGIDDIREELKDSIQNIIDAAIKVMDLDDKRYDDKKYYYKTRDSYRDELHKADRKYDSELRSLNLIENNRRMLYNEIFGEKYGMLVSEAIHLPIRRV